MAAPSTDEIAQLLLDWEAGDQAARDRLFDLIYADLCRLARSRKRGLDQGELPSTRSLVHETFLRLVEPGKVRAQNRAQFFSLAAKVMECLLRDEYDRQKSKKRGGEWLRVEFDECLNIAKEQDLDMEALSEALAALEALEPRQCSVVRLRFFFGLSVEETAYALNVSPDTVGRDWKVASAWLLSELSKKNGDDG